MKGTWSDDPLLPLPDDELLVIPPPAPTGEGHPCKSPRCVAMATVGDYCAVHIQGYRIHNSAHELRCWRCHRIIDRGELIVQSNGVDVRHAKRCKPAESALERQRQEGRRMR